MADETLPQKSIPPPAGEPTTEAKALNELRKEVVEARNLVIKTDNLLKNMHAELKKFGDRQEEFSKRRFWSSAAAYAIYTALVVTGAIVIAKGEGGREREAAQQAELKARGEQQKAEAAIKQAKDRKDASDRATRVYEQLSTEKEGPGLTQAITNAAKLDRKEISTLEGRALDDKLSAMREKLAASALEKGQSASRRSDHKTTSEELGRYLDLVPNASDPQLWFHLGYARSQLKDYAGAIDPLEKFLKAQSGGRLAQTAGYYLGIAYEETGALAKAAEALQRAVSLFPGSELAPIIRSRLRKLPGSPGSSPAAAPAPAPKAANPPGGLPPPNIPAATPR